MKQIDPPGQTPEQLVQFLEARRLALRSRNAANAQRHSGVRAILVMLGVAAAALTLLFSLLRPAHPAARQRSAAAAAAQR